MTERNATVMTVRGPVPVAELGRISPHEHIFIDVSCYVDELARFETGPLLNQPVTMATLNENKFNPYGSYDNCALDDYLTMQREVRRFKEAGGGTIVELTNADLGPQHELLRKVSEATGVHIVAGCGHYITIAHSPDMDEQTVESIEARLLKEIREGFDESGIRPGIIGEIGTSATIHPNEEKTLRAAGRVQRQTGLAVSVHVHPPARRGHEILDILAEEGADLDRVILSHLDPSLVHPDIDLSQAVEYHESLADRGAYIEYDLCGDSGYFSDGTNSWWLPSDRERIVAIARLVADGYGDRILIAQDIGMKYPLTQYGGWGYAHVLTKYRDMFESVGLDLDWHDRITVVNPARALVGSDAAE
ncbi:phosphotriesterase family protein [Herbiconiux sp. YIM B11900]|uniref:phosphotriesterase family protein n=1 Tax=Herbiconiux sp. YIM B11900 TaxID=3404131 RepID=UPI003F86D7B3